MKNSFSPLLRKYAQKWDIKISAPFDNFSYNYTAPARLADGTSVVIKTGFPSEELRAEIAALRHFNGRSIVRLYEENRKDCIFLLEKISPGTSLAELDDDKATDILLNLMPKLWKPYHGKYPFPTTKDWGRGFSRLRKRYKGETGLLNATLVDKAENLFADLLASSDSAVLLHGDLHHGNVLISERESYLAIDPKGVLGEPAYEVGAFLRNPMPDFLKKANPRATMTKRVNRIVEKLGFDRQRIIAWGMSQAVLSAIWCDEDSMPCGRYFMQIAEIFERF